MRTARANLREKGCALGVMLAEAAVVAVVFHWLVGPSAVSGAALGLAVGLAGGSVSAMLFSIRHRRVSLRHIVCPLALVLMVAAHARAFCGAWPPAPWTAAVSLALLIAFVVGNRVYRFGHLFLVALSAVAGALLL